MKIRSFRKRRALRRAYSSLLLWTAAATVAYNLHSASTAGFVVNHPIFPTCSSSSSNVKQYTFSLYAKKQEKKQNNKNRGFGVATTTSKTKKQVNNDDGAVFVKSDYSLFPALEPHVLDTLIPAQQGQIMSLEIYQRLDQIYGLTNFNYENRKQDDDTSDNGEPMMALSDLLSSSPSSSSSLESLLLGKDVEPTTTTTTTSNSALKLDLLPAWKDEDLQVLHVDPLVLGIQNFFTVEECDRYRAMSTTAMKSRSPTVGKDAVARAQRTSTTWYHYYEHVPELMAKASRLLGSRGDDDDSMISHWEEVQTVRYRPNEKFTWHLDALGPEQSTPAKGGQRMATLIVYLTDLTSEQGGATMFRDLTAPTAAVRASSLSSSSSSLSSSNTMMTMPPEHDDNTRLIVRPQKGSALLFFPSAGGIPNAPIDFRTLHCGQVVVESASDTDTDYSSDDKWIAQLWLRQGKYTPTAPSTDNKHDSAAVQQAIANYCTAFGTRG